MGREYARAKGGSLPGAAGGLSTPAALAMAPPRFQLQHRAKTRRGRRREGEQQTERTATTSNNSNNSYSNNSNNSNDDEYSMSSKGDGKEEAGAVMKDPEAVATSIVDAAYWIHVKLGPGLTESTYETILAHELEKRGHEVVRQKTFGFCWDGVLVRKGLKADLIVDGCVVVEVKASETTPRVHRRQVLTYLRALDLRLGLLVNFGAATMKEGLFRIVNQHDEADSPLRIAGDRSRGWSRWSTLRRWFRPRMHGARQKKRV